MKKLTRIIAVIACLAILCTAFAACGKDKKTTATTDGKSFTYWAVMESKSRATLDNYDEMLFYQVMQEKTGVDIEFIHPIQGSLGQEAFMTMISGEELPDMIEYLWSAYSGGPQAAIDDGILIALNDYLEEYAPNFYNYVEGEEAKKRNYSTYLSATTAEGNYYGFNVLNLGATECFGGLFVRGDLAEKWGLPIPETIDEWTAYLAKAKAEGFDKPLTLLAQYISSRYDDQHSFNTAYDVGKRFYIDGGKVVFAPAQKGFKEYVAQMADWYSKGYIDPGFVTNDAAKVEYNLVNGISVAGFGSIGSGLGKYGPALAKINPDYVLTACPYPVAKKGDVSRFQQVCADATAQAIGITTQCGNYEAAVSFCDWIYSEEGIPTQLFGKEGDTYTIKEVDGVERFVYTDKVAKYEENGFSSLTEAMYHYGLPANHPGYNQHDDYIYNFYPNQYQIDAVNTWNLGSEEAQDCALPSLYFTPEEKEENTDASELVETELEILTFDIIRGEKSIDEWDAGLAELQKIGYNTMLKNYQAAYDRYLEKKENVNK